MLLILIMLLIGANALYYKNENMYKLSWVLLILYAGLRYNYGNDYISYEVHYREITSMNNVFSSIYEVGYCIALYILKCIGIPFRGFVLIVAIVAIGTKTIAINKMNTNKYLSLLLYFLLFYIFNDTEQMRHGLALGICLLATSYIIGNEKDYRKFYLLVSVAFLFHYSAIVFIVAPLGLYLLSNKKIVIGAALLAIMLAVLDVTSVISFINDTIIKSDYIATKLALYHGQDLPIITGSLLVRLFTLMLIFQAWIKDKDNQTLKNGLKLYYLGVLLFVGFGSLEIIATRGSIFYRYIEIILLGYTLNKNQDKWIKYQSYVLMGYYFYKFISTVINPIYWNYTIM